MIKNFIILGICSIGLIGCDDNHYHNHHGNTIYVPSHERGIHPGYGPRHKPHHRGGRRYTGTVGSERGVHPGYGSRKPHHDNGGRRYSGTIGSERGTHSGYGSSSKPNREEGTRRGYGSGGSSGENRGGNVYN